MKIFLDTNVILENFLVREDFSVAHKLFLELQKQKHQLCMSVGGFYTMIFLVDKYLRKEMGLIAELERWYRGTRDEVLYAAARDGRWMKEEGRWKIEDGRWKMFLLPPS